MPRLPVCGGLMQDSCEFKARLGHTETLLRKEKICYIYSFPITPLAVAEVGRNAVLEGLGMMDFQPSLFHGIQKVLWKLRFLEWVQQSCKYKKRILAKIDYTIGLEEKWKRNKWHCKCVCPLKAQLDLNLWPRREVGVRVWDRDA